MRGRTLCAALGCCAVLVFAGTAAGQVYKDITVTADHTTGLVAPSTGTVSENYTFWLVNSGQATEDIDVGFGETSSGVSHSVSGNTTAVGPGQTAVVTVTIEGAGGLFPYWADFWAGIAEAPDTRDTVRLTIDTVGSAIETPSARTSRPPVSGVRASLGSVSVVDAAPGSPVQVFTVDGRLMTSGTVADDGTAMLDAGNSLPVIRLRGPEIDRSGSTTAE